MSHTNVIIRDATATDIPQMAGLMTELGYPTTNEEMAARFEQISRHPDYRTLLVEKDGKVVGLAGLAKGFYYEHNGGYIRILAFVISATYRGQGIGKALLSAIEAWALSQNIKILLLNSGNREERKDAFLFYEHQGFSIKSSGFVKQL